MRVCKLAENKNQKKRVLRNSSSQSAERILRTGRQDVDTKLLGLSAPKAATLSSS